MVLHGGEPLVWFDRKGRHLVTFPGTSTDRSWADALVALVKEGRASAVEVRKVDGESVNVAPADRAAVSAMPDVLDALRAAGFVDGYRGLTHRG